MKVENIIVKGSCEHCGKSYSVKEKNINITSGTVTCPHGI